MKRHRGSYVLAALGLAILMAGCWGSDKSTSLDVSGGASPIATATAVGIDKCFNCHANTAVAGAGIFETWSLSRHGNNDGTHADLPPTNFFGDPPEECNGCHDPNGDSLNLQKYTGFGSTPNPRNVIGCEACHGGGSLHFGVGPIGGPTLGVYAVAASTGQSSQYNTCIRCHVERNSIHDPSQPFGTVDEIIYDTHFDNGARAQGSDIQGYVIRKALGTSCTDCHNPHSVNLVEARQWKASAHADFTGLPWKEDPWKDQTSSSYCKRCHTATSFVIYTDDQNVAYNDPIHTQTFIANGVVDNMSEVLYCRACHKIDPARGFTVARRVPQDARIPGAWDNGQVVYSSTAGLNSYTKVAGMGDSELCMNCHSSRPSRNGFFVRPYLTSGGRNIDNVVYGSITPHYLVAVQTVFQDNTKGIGGYALPGRNYANPSYFEHNKIGTADAPGTGSGGPCVGCHMSSPADNLDVTVGSHSFMPVTEDNTGNISAITSTMCVVCHNGIYALTPTELNNTRDLVTARVAEFRAALEAQSIFPNEKGNQFYTSASAAATDNSSVGTVKNWQTRATALGTGIDGYDLWGICWNFNLLNYDPAEPCAWVHNNIYANRLIYDAIFALGATPSFARP